MEERNDGFFGANRAHIIQSLAILVPVFGALLIFYIQVRIDISQAQQDIRSLQTIIAGNRDDEKAFVKETTATLQNIQELITQLRIELAKGGVKK